MADEELPATGASQQESIVRRIVGAFFRVDVVHAEPATARCRLGRLECNRPGCIGWCLGISRFISTLAVIIVYSIWYVVYIQQGNIKEYVGVYGTTTNVWGFATTAGPNGTIIFDAQDLVIPAEENSAFFVATNPIITTKQRRGECAESAAVNGAACRDKTDCLPGRVFLDGHGVSTGECNETTHTCVVQAWCPLEVDSNPASKTMLNRIGELRVFIKNYVNFKTDKHSDQTLTNAKDTTNVTGCEYDEKELPNCPVFTLDYIFEQAVGRRKRPYDQLIAGGGVIDIKITWDCDFRMEPEKCNPTYKFSRLDTGERENAQGYYVKKTDMNGIDTRELFTAHGVLFIITVDAKAKEQDDTKGFLQFSSSLAFAGAVFVLFTLVGQFCHSRKTGERVPLLPQSQNI